MTYSQTVAQGQNIVAEHNNWIDQELHKSVFHDARLLRRVRVLLGQLAQAPGQSIALVCQDWANTKAAYRFLSNLRVSEADILAGHFEATRERIAAAHETPVLVLHDTTEFSWQRESAQAIGVLGKTNSGRDAEGRIRHHTVCGILMHSSLAITTEGLPLERVMNIAPHCNASETSQNHDQKALPERHQRRGVAFRGAIPDADGCQRSTAPARPARGVQGAALAGSSGRALAAFAA